MPPRMEETAEPAEYDAGSPVYEACIENVAHDRRLS